MKKRTSANKAQQAAWRQHDLLFISSYGEDTDRQLTFAHFSEPSSELDASKATLRVLGWDDDDTNLKLDYVADKLHEKLTWPRDTTNLAHWRQQWAAAFELRPRQVITTAEELALRLAELAKRIRNRMLLVLPRESEKGELHKLLKAFKTALIHDLDEKAFADMYAQTITYGLFSAAVSRTVPGAGTAVDQGNIVDMVPVTNPFLKEMLQSFLKAGGRKGKLDFDELGIQEVVDLLNNPNTHLDAVRRDFGKRRRAEDPVIHFYEDFLKAYDKKLKVQRGVFYTPQPVVSYIVRSVHELLQTEFGLADGLADTATWGEMLKKHPDLKLPPLTDEPGEKRTISPDEPFVQILDPATGTATFLVEVIDVIHRTLVAKWEQQRLADAQQRAAWNDYVPKHLLPRLHAFELMMAPYAIAHMKIGLKLEETGYSFDSGERARIYLTNALEPWQKQLQLPELDALAHEAVAVNEIKRHKRFTVVIGNPPYAGHSVNNQLPWIVDKVHDYKRGLPDLQKPGQAKWLQDDYVKFLRFAEVVVNQSTTGVVGMITNHSFLDNPTFRGLRRSLIKSFIGLRFLDLHGNTKGREKNDAVSEDQNVFDIQQGVGISLLTAGFGESGASYGELWGSRDSKYSNLQKSSVRNSSFEKLVPVPEYYLFIRQDAGLRSEYERSISIHKAMGENGDPAPGIVTTQDEFAIAFTKSEMHDHIAVLVGTQTEDEARKIFRLCTQSQWNYANAKRELRKGDWINDIEPILYRPFGKC